MKGDNIRMCVRGMKDTDLEMVLSWRNHPDIRRYMYTRHEISLEEHQHWFKQASNDPVKYLLVFELESLPLGFASLQLLSDGGIAEWGFYTAPEAPKGTGRKLGKTVLRYAFDDLALHKICGQALCFNEGSIRFHESLGFFREGVLRQQFFDGTNYSDVICFGLLSSEWRKSGQIGD